MINFFDSEIIDILPEKYKSVPECVALSYALKKSVQSLVEKSKNTSVFAVIDTLPERMLDILAIELRTQYYDESLDIARKRTLIKNTMPWYNKAGTVSAVQEMIDKVFNDGVILEWFDTGGEPGTFKISTSKQVTPALIEEFRNLIDKVKNVRSHLDSVVVGNKVDLDYCIALGVISHSIVQIR